MVLGARETTDYLTIIFGCEKPNERAVYVTIHRYDLSEVSLSLVSLSTLRTPHNQTHMHGCTLHLHAVKRRCDVCLSVCLSETRLSYLSTRAYYRGRSTCMRGRGGGGGGGGSWELALLRVVRRPVDFY